MKIILRMVPPITTQPTYRQIPSGGDNTEWMIRPSHSEGTLPGLEYLGLIDTLIIKQKKEWLEIFTGYETQNKYVIRNKVGQQVYYAFEESDSCDRQGSCNEGRAFTIHIVDNFKKEVMRIKRPFACCSCCIRCEDPNNLSHALTVEAPPGRLIGSIGQQKAWCSPEFYVKDMNDKVQLKIGSNICSPVFNVQTLEGQVIGNITRYSQGLMTDLFSDADTFGMSVPMDLDIKTKATLIGATFLIDFMFYER